MRRIGLAFSLLVPLVVEASRRRSARRVAHTPKEDASMDHLLERIQTLEQQVQSLQQKTTFVARRLRWWRRLACVLVVLTVFSLPVSLSGAKGDEPGLVRGLAQRVRALERKLQHVTMEVGAGSLLPELVITGANLRIVNGLGFTESTNGTGNLIVGYNEPRPPGFIAIEVPLGDDRSGSHNIPIEVPLDDDRSGSHNIVVGQWHNFSSFGGLVVGVASEISGQWASVSGGVVNIASGFGASVSGGARNVARGGGGTPSISGGLFNTAIGGFSSISGGTENTTTNGAVGAWVTGGFQNTASNVAASVSGGLFNTASGVFASVSGGRNRTAAGEDDWVAGGLFQDQ
jgi:hypothetical protein